jgi:Tol biopolymer transport system component
VKGLTGGALLLIVLAAGAWGVALLDTAGNSAAWQDGLRSPGQPLPYPGAEQLVARRVVADGHPNYAPSPDGIRLAHQGSSGDLAILDLRTGRSRFLTGDPSAWRRRPGTSPMAIGPRFSPDGQRLAYDWIYRGADNRMVRAIRVLELESGEVREVLRDTPPGGQVSLKLGSWSPDGETLAAIFGRDGSRAGPGQLVLLRPGNGSVTTIASFETRSPQGAIFSPDGRWLAYGRVRERGSEDHDIFLRRVDGSVELRLTQAPGDHQVAGWLPGGGPFYYMSGERGRYDLLAVDLENGRAASRPHLVRSDLWRVSPLGFSADAFFYLQTVERVQPYTAQVDLEAARLTGPLVPLFPASSASRSAVVGWSPDGERMAYFDGSDLIVRSPGSGAERRIPTDFRGIIALEWSPVSDRIVIHSQYNEAGPPGIHLLDLSDGNADLVMPNAGPVAVAEPRWSTDGQALFVARRPVTPLPAREIVRVDLETREEKVLFKVQAERDPAFAGFALHPDGRWLAVGKRGSSSGVPDRVILIPLQDGEPRELVRLEAPEGISVGFYPLEWTPDGRHLMISSNPDREQRKTVWIVDVEGTRLRELATIDSGMARAIHYVRPRLHAGGRELSVIAGRNRWEVWTLENLRAEPLGRGGAVP